MLRAIGKGIFALLKGTAKFCAFLLTKLGLWIPVLYALVYVLVCAFTGTKLAGAALTAFCLGLGVAAAGGLLFSVYRLTRRHKKSAEEKKADRPAVKKIRGGVKRPPNDAYCDDGERTSDDAFYDGKNGNSADGGKRSTEYGRSFDGENRPTGAAGAQPERYRAAEEYDTGMRDLDEKYFGTNGKKTDGFRQENTGPEDPVATDRKPLPDAFPDFRPGAETLGAKELLRRLEGESARDERPLVFRLKSGRNIFVYEYSDRLQYWRREGRNMTLLRTEFKRDRRRQGGADRNR